MATTAFPLDASSGAPSYNAQAIRQAFSSFLGTAPSGRPLGATSGVRPGTPSTTVSLSSFTWRCAAVSGVLDVETSATAGPYLFATDGTDSGTVQAADSTNPRVDIIYIQLNDNVQDASGAESASVSYLAGTPAASPVAPSPPNSRTLVLAQISVPKNGGGAPSVSWVASPWTAYTPWTSYVPAWTATTTNPAIGNGSISGYYCIDQTKCVTGVVTITMGSTTAYGSGAYHVSLPVAMSSAENVLANFLATGGIRHSNSSYVLVGEPTSTTSIFLGSSGEPTSSLTGTSPVTLTTGDTITVRFCYQSA